MKTVFLDQGETMGGMECWLRDLLKSMSKSDRKRLNCVLLGAKHKRYRDALANLEGLEIRDFPFPSVKGNVFHKAKAAILIAIAGIKLAYMCRKEDVTSVITNSPRAHFIALMAYILGGMRVRWIMTVHDFETQKSFWRHIHLYLNKLMYSFADGFIPISNITREHVRRLLKPDQYYKIRMIENGMPIDTIPVFTPPEHIKRFLIMQRFDPQKGQLYAVQAFHKLLNTYPEIELYLVGAIYKEDPVCVEYYNTVIDYVKTHHLSNVHILEQTDKPFDMIEKVDCIMSLSTRKETFGRVAIEALACNRYSIAFAEDGPKQIIEEFYTYSNTSTPSLLIPRDVDTLADKIVDMYKNSDSYSIYTPYMRSFVEKYYNLKDTTYRFVQYLLE